MANIQQVNLSKVDSLSTSLTTHSANKSKYVWLFLTYMPRSGSTYLAKLLSKSPKAILVLPETKLFEKLANMGNEEFARSDTAVLQEMVESDPRWKNMGIDDEQLRDLLDNNKTVLLFIEAFLDIMAARVEFEPAIVLIKNGASIWHIDKLLNIQSRSLLINIKRDPRGCINSRMKKLSNLLKLSTKE